MKRKHSLSYRILLWIVIIVSLFLIVASLFIEPYWHVDKSVWEAVAIMWAFVGLYDVLERATKGDNVHWKCGDFSIEIKGKKHKNTDELKTSK